MGNLTLDKMNYQAFRSGRSLELNPQEFTILWLLASKPGKTLSHEDIIHRMRNDFPEIVNEPLQKYIQALQEKVGENYIRFVQGLGYRMNFEA